MKRNATHAGSWYTGKKNELNKELEEYLENATKEYSEDTGKIFPIKGTRAIIGPHAGFRYSGSTAAFAYNSVNVSNIKRVFLLGPAHHEYIEGCALSQCDTYETPLGNLELDKAVLKEIYETGKFSWMQKCVDEDEHSIELHLPFVYKIFEKKIEDIKVVPILVGTISERKEKIYGELLAKYLEDPENLFIISSDFCHWGTRFRYTYYTETDDDHHPIHLSKTNEKQISRPIYESIQELDLRGIDKIETLSLSDFQHYLNKTRNTICGRHPIAVLMAALEKIREKKEFSNQKMECIKYNQSSQCERLTDSSVSYASFYVQIQ